MTHVAYYITPIEHSIGTDVLDCGLITVSPRLKNGRFWDFPTPSSLLSVFSFVFGVVSNQWC